MSQTKQSQIHWSKQPKPSNFASIPDDDDPEPKAPDMKIHPGYEGFTTLGVDHPADAPTPLPKPEGEVPNMQLTGSARVTAEECRAALLEQVSQHYCWGTKAVKNMTIRKVQPSTGIHYVLETFAESRCLRYTTEPYMGEGVDDGRHGPPPAPWDLEVTPATLFKSHVKEVSVPHTDNVLACWRCETQGWQRCGRCGGGGAVKCARCHGKGRVHRRRTTSDGIDTEMERCKSCAGTGGKKCGRCAGHGRVTCIRCGGNSKVKCFIQLVVKFVNHKSEYIYEATDMPDELVKHVNGIVLFQQTLPQVWPITTYDEDDVNANSMRLVEQHRTGFPNERHVHQRQTLRGVPVTEAHYQWNDKSLRFWIYGLQKSVYHPDYPQKQCCGCTIL